MKIELVKGKNIGKIMLYGLSTCVWCKKLKKLLDDLGLEYSYIYPDLLEGDERKQARKVIEKWNPRCSFPTLIINDKDVIVGYAADKIKETLGLV